MTIELQLPPRLAALAESGTVQVDHASSLRELRLEVATRYPVLADRLWTKEGNSRPQVRWFVNGIDCRYLDQMNTCLYDGDKVVVIPETLWQEEQP